MVETKKNEKVRKKPSKKDEAAEDEDTEKSIFPFLRKREKVAKEIEKVQAKRKVKRTIIRKKKKLKKVDRKARDIGIDVSPPEDSCDDSTCPFHGTLPVRGQIIDGIIITSKMDKSVVVSKERLRYIPKFERYEKRSSHYTAHNPVCIDAQMGEQVRIMECRPLSKTKSFVVIERMKS
ncbi:MAG: 30S ribosomal protein S17 [Thermoplasmata archaeon]|nr:MAG: 30S ribosomal protein S17 [Thermoplasmata archaeon]